MGSKCRIVSAGPHELAAEAIERVRELEQSWSRFLPTSEVSRINAASGSLVLTSPDTFELLRRAEQARRWTGGRFNPLMLDQLCQAGHDRPFSSPPFDRDNLDTFGAVTPACDEPIELYPEIRGVVLPAGTRFDPGGIGKGLAADLVCEALRDAGATTAMVDLGGDLRLHGTPWDGDHWTVELAAPQDRTSTMGSLTLAGDGAVATSSVLSRRWRQRDTTRHHLIDPDTGTASSTDLLTATVLAPTAWQAEVAAKAALLAGRLGVVGLLNGLGVHGVAVTRDGGSVSNIEGSPTTHAEEGSTCS